jgi:type IV secretion system protein VirD4
MGCWCGCCRLGLAVDASSAAPGGRAGGICADSSSLDLGGGGSSSAAATASETGSSAGSTWPSNNATRVLAFGPPGSFKTHGLVIPAILEWQGNLVTTSIKPDVLRATCAHRANLGAVWVYDPLGLSGVPGARWTPLAYCRSYSDARRIGRMLADAADIGGHRAEDANYWQLLGAKLLSVLLFAAAGTGRSMADVARWVDVQDVDDVAQALMEIGNPQALDAWAACTSRPDNTMGSVYGTAETLLDVYGDPTIAASAEGCDLDLDELLTGANNTLYLYAPASEQERLRPLLRLSRSP